MFETIFKSSSFAIESIEKSSATSDSEPRGVFAGYASVFEVADQDQDIFARGAFDGVDARKVRMLRQHKRGVSTHAPAWARPC